MRNSTERQHPDINARILAEINRRLIRRISAVYSRQRQGADLRTRLRAMEGLELEGYEPYQLDLPTSLIDLETALVPLQFLAHAIVNEDVLARNYQLFADESITFAIDTSTSMCYPLTRLYQGRTLPGFEDADLDGACALKPSLVKLVAGVLMTNAVESGFTVRLLSFDHRAVIEDKPIRRKLNLSSLCQRIDRWFESACKASSPSSSAQSPYELLAERLQSRREPVFVLGDFMDGGNPWDQTPKSDRWTKMLGLFRQRALRYSLVVARINHENEVTAPRELPSDEDEPKRHPYGDFCDVDPARPQWLPRCTDQEWIARFRTRMIAQERWRKALREVLASACCGFLEIDNRTESSGALQGLLFKSWKTFASR